MNDLSGIYSSSYIAPLQKSNLLLEVVLGGSWICLILSPWMMMLLSVNMMGLLQLTLVSQILMTAVIICAAPQFFTSDKHIRVR